SFQGEESKIVIVSLVRSNSNGDIGFLRSSNRVNVLLSRAQHGMYIIGNAGKTRHHCMLRAKNGTIWSESVIPTLQAKGAIGSTIELQCARHEDTVTTITKPEEFDSLAGDGGCSRPCSFRLPCGHACVRRCHPDDPEHHGVHCSEPCPRLLQPCEHPCTRLCGDECGPCTQRVDTVDLPCGHEAKNVSCAASRNPKTIRCWATVKLEVPGCGDMVKGECTAMRAIVNDPTRCPNRCRRPLPCGHACLATCGSCTRLTTAAKTRTHHEPCTAECGRSRPCGHRCRRPCHDGSVCPPCPERCALTCEHSSCAQPCTDPCAPCAESCTWNCPHLAGPCRLPCGAPCVRLPCDRRCERQLSCGHRCPSVCGEGCPGPGYCRECSTSGGAMDQVVDMLEFTTLKEHDPSLEPIIVLDCGHAYTLSTLDGFMGLESVYVKDKQSGEWIMPRPLQSDCSVLKLCPDCRAPVMGVSRYKRVTEKAKIDMAEVKNSQWCRHEIGRAETSMAEAVAGGMTPK
ncbi:unnamed protein product, partial [Sphacelaria rigidula]